MVRFSVQKADDKSILCIDCGLNKQKGDYKMSKAVWNRVGNDHVLDIGHIRMSVCRIRAKYYLAKVSLQSSDMDKDGFSRVVIFAKRADTIVLAKKRIADYIEMMENDFILAGCKVIEKEEQGE
jgi:hypothetical protein